MATQTPPPYFPQSSLSPPNESRYRKFKIIVVSILGLLLLLIGAGLLGAVYFLRWLL